MFEDFTSGGATIPTKNVNTNSAQFVPNQNLPAGVIPVEEALAMINQFDRQLKFLDQQDEENQAVYEKPPTDRKPFQSDADDPLTISNEQAQLQTDDDKNYNSSSRRINIEDIFAKAPEDMNNIHGGETGLTMNNSHSNLKLSQNQHRTQIFKSYQQ